MKFDDTLTSRRVGRSAPAKYRELVAAHLVMSLADLRLKKRANERSRRLGRPSQ